MAFWEITNDSIDKASSIPTEASILKDASHPSGIYANDAAKAALEQRIAASGITGMGFRKV